MCRNNRLLTQIVGGIVLPCVLCWAQRPQTPEEKLAEGEAVVRGYSAEDVVPTSQAEFSRGVALIEEALRENVKDRRRALLALVAAGSVGPNGPNPSPKRLTEVFKELLNLYPRDPEVLKLYAAHLESTDPKAALPAYLHLLDVQPDNAEALFMVSCYRQDAGEVALAAQDITRAVHMKSADPDMIELFIARFESNLNALGNSRFVPAVSAAAFDALAAQTLAGNAKAAFVSAALRVQLGQAKAGVEEFLRALKLAADENTIHDGLERIDSSLYDHRLENAPYIEQVSAAAAEALKALAEKEAREKKMAGGSKPVPEDKKQ
jgi:tetratricopeptide (TPR) repeat protein